MYVMENLHIMEKITRKQIGKCLCVIHPLKCTYFELKNKKETNISSKGINVHTNLYYTSESMNQYYKVTTFLTYYVGKEAKSGV